MTYPRLLLAALLACQVGFLAAAEVQGHLDWARRVEMSTPVSGTVERVMADVGDRVPKGEALLTLDQRPFRARVSKAQAELSSAKEALAEAEREVGRAQELFDRQVMSTHELQLAKIAHSDAQAAFQRARSELELAKLDLEYATVRAPYPSIVLHRRVEPGQTVVTRLQTSPLLVLASSEQMVARMMLTPEQLAQVKPGAEMEVRVGGRAYPGKVANLGLEPTQGETGPRYEVEVRFPASAEDDLRAGQVASIDLP